LWRSLGHFDLEGSFRIDGVTGPDEYSAVADNNIYTNLMARRNLRGAAAACERYPERANELGVSAYLLCSFTATTWKIGPIDHPVCGAKVASRLFLNAAATPPVSGGEFPHERTAPSIRPVSLIP